LSTESYHPVENASGYVTVILPIAAPKPYTYMIPLTETAVIQAGMRVEVQFGKTKIYAALVVHVHNNPPESYKAKPIISVIDQQPIAFPYQFKLWKWLAEYYSCTMGEVMNAALPGGFKLASETKLILSPVYDENYRGLKDKEFLIAEALHYQNELSISEVRKILKQKNVGPLINRLLSKKVIYIKEELKEKYKPKKVICVKLQEPYASVPDTIEEAFELMSRSSRQVETLMAFVQVSRKQPVIRRSELIKAANVDTTVINAMVKKKVFELYEKEVSRLGGYEEEVIDSHKLTDQQIEAIKAIKKSFEDKSATLLHGVTGSGKTRVYVELIQEAIDRGEQVLYLLPEIALTTQIIVRLQKIFGDDIAVYHSRLNNNERVELWKQIISGKKIILGARSSLFLPFKNLRLIIVDEEHDTSFKQMDPAPRYNARDAAIYLANLCGAKVLLGTATPSVETYFNTTQNKYGLVEMPERFGGIKMPEVVLVDLKEETKKKTMKGLFSSVLLTELEEALGRNEQAILFQNRRGYAPTFMCGDCGWHSQCTQCDVGLTLHMFTNNLRCHYCGYQIPVPKSCPACGNMKLAQSGYGTEKVEDELKIYLPEARIGRMDFDTAKGKHSLSRIINDFEEHRIDILVGTQMVTKGLDFDNVGIVGVLSADHILQFPDFRSNERGFQLITQVSGRAGRKHKQGKVLVQTYNTTHPVLDEVLHNDFQSFFLRELDERHSFDYPPYHRLIELTVKHIKADILNEATKVLIKILKDNLGKRVLGPAVPGIPRVRNQYILKILIKMERDAKAIKTAKQLVTEATSYMQSQKGFSTVRVNVNVDPV